jgi:hypothetical protein
MKQSRPSVGYKVVSKCACEDMERNMRRPVQRVSMDRPYLCTVAPVDHQKLKTHNVDSKHTHFIDPRAVLQ